jgi:chromosome segregation ATPase
MILLVGLSGYLGYRLNLLQKDHATVTSELSKTNHRAKLLKQKYIEQKAQASALQRAKLTVEGLKRQAEMKAKTLAEKLDKAAAGVAAVEKQYNAKVKALEKRIAVLDDKINQDREEYAALADTLRQAKKKLVEQEGTIATMEENTRQLESELQFASRTRDRYRADNRQLAETAKSILARYDEKGVFAKTIVPLEPFTQIKKVELEHLIQAYLDEIDDHVIGDDN